ncbi:MAG: fibronectin type III domain-containing protein [Patescibacteria group bacterium]
MNGLRKMIGRYLGERGGMIALRTLLLVFFVLLVVSFVGFGGQDGSGIFSLNFEGDNFTLIAPQFAGAQSGAVAPYAPTGLSATTISQTQINLSWTDNATNETGYRVYRNTVNVSGDLANSTVSYNNYSLTCGTSYSYYVQAFNSYGSSNSNTVSQSTVVCTPPAPTGVTATAVSQTQINISWSAVSGATYYNVYRSTTLVGSPPGTSFSDTGLSAGTSYTYYVKACNAGGCSANSTGSSATTDVATPGTPTIGSATPTSQTAATVTWTRNSPYTESGFEIWSNGVYVGTGSAGATSGSASGLSCGTAYTFQVRAFVITNGRTYYSGYSGSTSLITTDQCTPSTPTIGSCSVTGQTTAAVSWTDTSSNETGFVIYDSGATQRGTAGAGATSGTASGLTANTSYQFNVKSYVTTNGRTYYSTASANTASCTTLPNPPPTPTGFTATTISGTQINLSWNAVSGATSYTLAHPGGPAIYSGASTSFSETGLTCGTSYSYTVYASNAGGNSSNASASATTVVCAPSAPTGLIATTLSTSQIYVSWNAVSGATSYTVAWSGGSQTVTGTSYTINGLSCGTYYGIGVTANNAGGSSSESTVTGNTTVCAPSSAPTGVTATPASTTQINLSWNSVSGATGYRVWRDGVNIQNVVGTSYSDTGLTCGTSYSYYIQAYNAGGTGPSSGTVNTSTNVCLPASPSFSTVCLNGVTQPFAVWNTSSGATGYKLYRAPAGGPQTLVYNGTSTGFLDSSLNSNTVYTYYVSAYNGSGESSQTSQSVETGNGVFNSFSVSLSGTSTANLSWTNPNPSWSVANVVIYRNGSQIYNAGGPTSITTYTDTGLSPNTSYEYYIFYGYSPPCGLAVNETSNTDSILTPPATPTGLTATAVSQTQINISWNAVSGATSYTLAHPGGPTIYSGASTSFSETGLTCNTSYSYTVSACNAGGCSANASASATTSACDTTSPTFLISGSGANWMTSASTTATASDESGISYVRHCWVDTQSVPPCDPGTTAASTFTNGATLTQTTSGSSWYACFRASDAAGNWTPTLTLGNYATYCWGPVRVDVTAPTPTPTPSQTSADSTSVTVSAGVTGSDAHSGLDANAYGFSTNGTNYTWTSSNSYTFTNLTCNTNYTAYVKIRDAVGNMTSAGTASINTSSCVVPPSAVSGLSVTEQSGGSGLNASWNNVSADGYRVYMKGGRSSPNTVSLIQNSSGTSVPQTGLQCPSSYTVYVVAYNSDASIGGVDSSCSTTFSSGDLSTVGTVPSNVKCSSAQSATVEVRSCTRGFLLE